MKEYSEVVRRSQEASGSIKVGQKAALSGGVSGAAAFTSKGVQAEGAGGQG